MYRRLAHAVFPILGILGAGVAAAGEPAGDPAPIRIEAERRGMVDMAEGRASFSGNVRMTRGDLRLQADEAELDWSGETLKKAVFTGTPARFEQPATGERAAVTGRASEIEYFADSGRIRLIGDAVVEEGNRRLEAQRIHYDTVSRRMEAGRDDNGDGRIRITIPAQETSDQAAENDTGNGDTGDAEESAEDEQ